MQTFIYRWQERAGVEGTRRGEIDGPIHEIRGDAYALWTVAKQLELPVRPFWSEFTDLDGNAADIWGASIAAKTERLRPPTELLWIRIGDAGDYASFTDLDAAIDDLNMMEVGTVDYWLDGGVGIGFATWNYHGHDFVSFFWGDAEANLIRALNADEKAYTENNLEAYLN
jgi:hypothetical protein